MESSETPRSSVLKQEQISAVDVHVSGDASIPDYSAVGCAVSCMTTFNIKLIFSSEEVKTIEERYKNAQIGINSNACGTQPSCNYYKSSQRSEHQINNRVARHYSCFTLFQRSRNLQCLCRKEGQKDLKSWIYYQRYQWQYVSTKQNPVDIGNWGSSVTKLTNHLGKYPAWLSSKFLWSSQPHIGLATKF